ncbi:serine/threonine-protein kinase [Streptomyces daliensis]
MTSLGLPKAISGNFASVFSLTTADGTVRHAVKCFTRYVPDQDDRYRVISKHLSGLPASHLSQPWNMGFDYLADEILVGGERYPILKMEWVQGQNLASWLNHHHRDSTRVGQLAERFEALVGDLHTHGIAHGDLQHGNLLVAPDLSFRLVDYDGMYVPALDGRRATEDGHRNYQSPLRGAGDFGPDMDRFSTWVIHAALTAVAADPRLWADLHEPSGEYLLLSEDDYKAPSTSPRFVRLLSHPNPDIAESARRIADLVAAPMNAIPHLLNREVGTATGTQQKSAASAATPPGTGLPDWLRDHIPSTAPASEAPLRPLGPGFHHRRRIRDLLVLPVLLLSVVVPVLVLLGVLSLDIIAAGIPAAAGAVLFSSARRSRPEYRELTQQMRGLKRRKWEAEHPEAAAERLDRERDAFEASERKRASKADRAGRDTTRAHQQKLAKIESDKQKRERELRAQLTRLDDELAADLAKRLKRHQQSYVDGQLQHALIAKAKIPGIGPALRDALAVHGVLTAADFRGITLVKTGGSYNSVTAYIDLAYGGRADIKGIGPAKAEALRQWREQQIATARARCPTILPAGDRQAAQAEFHCRQTDLQSRIRDLGTQAEAARRRAEADLRQVREQLLREAEQARTTALAQREAFARRTLQLRQATAEIPALDAALAAALRERRQLALFPYLRFLMIGRSASSPQS